MHRTRKIISVIGKLLLKRYVFSLKFNIYYSITINIEYYQPVWRRDHLRPVNELFHQVNFKNISPDVLVYGMVRNISQFPLKNMYMMLLSYPFHP